MTTYRRNQLAGGTYFFTVALANRRSRLLVERIDRLREAVRLVRRRHPFDIVAWVVLPDHLHTIWTLPPGDDRFPMRWRLIKAGFSRLTERGEPVSSSRSRKGERGVWQRRYWEHTIRDTADLDRHVDYVHLNPLKHGHVTRVGDWPFSTFHRDVERGFYPADWAGGPDIEGEFGE